MITTKIFLISFFKQQNKNFDVIGRRKKKEEEKIVTEKKNDEI